MSIDGKFQYQSLRLKSANSIENRPVNRICHLNRDLSGIADCERRLIFETILVKAIERSDSESAGGPHTTKCSSRLARDQIEDLMDHSGTKIGQYMNTMLYSK